jgi:hypothetical protein
MTPTAPDIQAWGAELHNLHRRISVHFERQEPRVRALHYLRGLLQHFERKNGWQLAEKMGVELHGFGGHQNA